MYREQPTNQEVVNIRNSSEFVRIYDVRNESDARDLVGTLARLSSRFDEEGERITADMTLQEALAKAKNSEGDYYRDQFAGLSEDLLKLDVPKGYFDTRAAELDDSVRERDTPENYRIVELLWKKGEGRFTRILKQEDYERTVFSRNKYSVTEKSLEGIREAFFGVAGCGVGKDIAVILTQMGAKKIRLADGGDITGHDCNRNGESGILELGQNHAVNTARTLININPYIQVECLPYNLDSKDLKVEDFLNGLTFVFDEMDSLPTKVKFELLCHKMNVHGGRVTDLGLGSSFSYIIPNELPFNGRGTPEALAALANPDMGLDQKTQLAAAIIVGFDNIPPHYLEALGKARIDGAPYWPQNRAGVAQSMNLVITALAKYFEEGITEPEVKTSSPEALFPNNPPLRQLSN